MQLLINTYVRAGLICCRIADQLIEPVRNICLCFGRYGSRGLLSNIMSYTVFRFTYHRPLQSYSLAYFFLGLRHPTKSVADWVVVDDQVPFPSNVGFCSVMCRLREGLKLLSFTYFDRGEWGHVKEGHFLSLSIG